MGIRDFVLDVYANLRQDIEDGRFLDAFVTDAVYELDWSPNRYNVCVVVYRLVADRVHKSRILYVYDNDQVFEFDSNPIGFVRYVGE